MSAGPAHLLEGSSQPECHSLPSFAPEHLTWGRGKACGRALTLGGMLATLCPYSRLLATKRANRSEPRERKLYLLLYDEFFVLDVMFPLRVNPELAFAHCACFSSTPPTRHAASFPAHLMLLNLVAPTSGTGNAYKGHEA